MSRHSKIQEEIECDSLTKEGVIGVGVSGTGRDKETTEIMAKRRLKERMNKNSKERKRSAGREKREKWRKRAALGREVEVEVEVEVQ